MNGEIWDTISEYRQRISGAILPSCITRNLLTQNSKDERWTVHWGRICWNRQKMNNQTKCFLHIWMVQSSKFYLCLLRTFDVAGFRLLFLHSSKEPENVCVCWRRWLNYCCFSIIIVSAFAQQTFGRGQSDISCQQAETCTAHQHISGRQTHSMRNNGSSTASSFVFATIRR